MNNKQQYYKWVEMGIITTQTPEQRVEILANKLLEVLYTPTEKKGLFIPDWGKIANLGIDEKEPINWADLKATVELKGEIFVVTIDEASPGACETLCDYIEKYLVAWGWTNVIVKTEW